MVKQLRQFGQSNALECTVGKTTCDYEKMPYSIYEMQNLNPCHAE